VAGGVSVVFLDVLEAHGFDCEELVEFEDGGSLAPLQVLRDIDAVLFLESLDHLRHLLHVSVDLAVEVAPQPEVVGPEQSVFHILGTPREVDRGRKGNGCLQEGESLAGVFVAQNVRENAAPQRGADGEDVPALEAAGESLLLGEVLVVYPLNWLPHIVY